jgi:hypothetical protein
MSTPTAIEIVRNYHRAREMAAHYVPQDDLDEQLTAALASVLRDAERFQALERAHGGCDSPDAWSYVNSEGERRFYKEPLAELADKLRSEK